MPTHFGSTHINLMQLRAPKLLSKANLRIMLHCFVGPWNGFSSYPFLLCYYRAGGLSGFSSGCELSGGGVAGPGRGVRASHPVTSGHEKPYCKFSVSSMKLSSMRPRTSSWLIHVYRCSIRIYWMNQSTGTWVLKLALKQEPVGPKAKPGLAVGII